MRPLPLEYDLSQLPTDKNLRHEQFVDFFGQFLFWLRNGSLNASRKLIESPEARERLGTIRRRYYEDVAQMPVGQRDAAMQLVEETLNACLERMTSMLGDEGTDARIGVRHAYRFRLEMEIVDVETGEIVDSETINRGGSYFGRYWGKWLNRYSSIKSS
jgi:hypothetical protein